MEFAKNVLISVACIEAQGCVQVCVLAVRPVLNGEGSLKSIAKAHDITHTLLMIWVDKYRRGELTDEIDYVERAREAEAKIAALERKVGQLTMELDVLKKMRQSVGGSSEKVSIISGPLASPSSKDAAS